MVIDFHTHIFPEKIAAGTIEVLKGNIRKLHPDEDPQSYTEATLDSLKESMRKNGIAKAVVMPIATTVRQSKTINNYAAQVNADADVYSFGSVHPLQENLEEEMERLATLGLPGIKLHPEYQQFYVDSPEGIRVLKKAAQLGLYVMYHTGRDVGVQPPVHCMPQNLARALDAVPDAKVIGAHMGGWMVWEDVETYLCGRPIYFDTSYSLHLMSNEQFLRILEKHGVDWILFGTDSPWGDQGEGVAALENAGIGRDALEKILWKNGAHILGIE